MLSTPTAARDYSKRPALIDPPYNVTPPVLNNTPLNQSPKPPTNLNEDPINRPVIHTGVAPIYVNDLPLIKDPSQRTTQYGAFFAFYYKPQLDRYALQEQGEGTWVVVFVYADLTMGGFEWNTLTKRYGKSITPLQLGIDASRANMDLTLRPLTPPIQANSWWPTEWHRIYWVPLSALSTIVYLYVTEPQ